MSMMIDEEEEGTEQYVQTKQDCWKQVSTDLAMLSS